MPPTEFLRTYLNSHEQWRNFVGILREATLEQQTPGLGFEVSNLCDADFEVKLKAASPSVSVGQVPVRAFYDAINVLPVDENVCTMPPRISATCVSCGRRVRCPWFLGITRTGQRILEISRPQKMEELIMGEVFAGRLCML